MPLPVLMVLKFLISLIPSRRRVNRGRPPVLMVWAKLFPRTLPWVKLNLLKVWFILRGKTRGSPRNMKLFVPVPVVSLKFSGLILIRVFVKIRSHFVIVRKMLLLFRPRKCCLLKSVLQVVRLKLPVQTIKSTPWWCRLFMVKSSGLKPVRRRFSVLTRRRRTNSRWVLLMKKLNRLVIRLRSRLRVTLPRRPSMIRNPRVRPFVKLLRRIRVWPLVRVLRMRRKMTLRRLKLIRAKKLVLF